MRILYKVTTKSRRSQFLRAIDSIVDNTINHNWHHVLVSVENEYFDKTMHPLPVLECPHTYRVNKYAPSTKIDAINRDVNEFNYDWHILVNLSDDQVFRMKGFDNIIREHCGLDDFVHFPDGNNPSLCTMSIMGRDYYNRTKYIYHPEYKSLWCDNEAQEVAKILGRYKFVDKRIFDHLHPAYGKAQMDSQYVKTESFSYIDRETFYKRKQINFGL
jgi:hypothetical protein